MLREIAQDFGGPRAEFAVEVERHVERILAELKPGRELPTDVEFYVGAVRELPGLPCEMFTPTFAAASGVRLERRHPGTGDGDSKTIRPVARWPGGPVARWPGGAVARWRGGAVARWRGGAVARWPGTWARGPWPEAAEAVTA